MATMRSACALLIGNELLSGRTQDQNLAYLGEKLNEYGIRLMEARVIPDIPEVITEQVNAARQTFDYVFTTGGIGPTHDDITTENVARAFGVEVERRTEAVELLSAHYEAKQKVELNDARLKMADIPVGAELIYNSVSAAPGFILENVYVMAGVPSIMRAMLDSLADRLSDGPSMLSETIEADVPEGDIAHILSAAQYTYAQVEIGCYPKFQAGKLSSTLVLRSLSDEDLCACADHLRDALEGWS